MDRTPRIETQLRLKNIKGWETYALNYRHKEVRDYQLSFVRELFERYDFDGIECDWMRIFLHLTPEKGMEEAHFLSEFMSDVRKIADEYENIRGHKIDIAVRVPASPRIAAYVGSDAVAWAKAGLVDMIIPTPAWIGTFNISTREWKAALGDAANKVTVVAGAESGILGCLKTRRIELDMPLVNGWIENSEYCGADGTYFFNLIYVPKAMSALAEQGAKERTMRNLPRRHPITLHDYVEMPNNPANKGIQLPKSDEENCEFSVQFGRIPDRDSEARISAVIGFGSTQKKNDSDNAKGDSYEVFLNGIKADSFEYISNPDEYCGVKSAIRFRFSTGAAKNGFNKISLKKTAEDAPCLITWVELDSNL